MRIFTPYLFFQCVFNDFQCVITPLRALSVALMHDPNDKQQQVIVKATHHDSYIKTIKGEWGRKGVG